MELRHLRAFIAVAERGSFTKAAETLHIAQPPLSRRIQQLEQEIGTKLFVREGHGATLTAEGRQLLEQARIVVAESVHFMEIGRSAATQSGTIRIGLSIGLLDALMHLQSHHSAKYPAVTLEFTDMLSSEQYDALRRRKIDVGFLRVVGDCPRVEYERLFLERFVVLVSENNPLSTRRSLKLRDLAAEPVLLHQRDLATVPYDKTLALYAAAGIIPHIITFPAILTTQAAMMLVASGKAIAFGLESELSRMYLEADGVAVVPLDEPDATLEVRMAWRSGENAPSVLRLLDSARAALRDAPVQVGHRRIRHAPLSVASRRTSSSKAPAHH
jgi:DNA-binding transcriptional LysR family regulator